MLLMSVGDEGLHKSIVFANGKFMWLEKFVINFYAKHIKKHIPTPELYVISSFHN